MPDQKDTEAFAKKLQGGAAPSSDVERARAMAAQLVAALKEQRVQQAMTAPRPQMGAAAAQVPSGFQPAGTGSPPFTPPASPPAGSSVYPPAKAGPDGRKVLRIAPQAAREDRDGGEAQLLAGPGHSAEEELANDPDMQEFERERRGMAFAGPQWSVAANREGIESMREVFPGLTPRYVRVNEREALEREAEQRKRDARAEARNLARGRFENEYRAPEDVPWYVKGANPDLFKGTAKGGR